MSRRTTIRGEPISADDLPRVLRAMCDDWASVNAAGNPVRPNRYGRDEVTFRLLFGLNAQAHELVRGALPIMEPMTLAAHSVVRSVFELGVTAQCVFRFEGAELQVAKEGVRQRRNLIAQMHKSSQPGFREAAAGLDEPMPERLADVPRMPSFESLCGDFQEGDDLYMHYRLMSGNVHAGAEAADRWLTIDNDRLVLRAHPREDQPSCCTSPCWV